MLGVVGAATWHAGMALSLWSFVAPHGVLELPAILIAGGAGLEIARGILFPGTASAARIRWRGARGRTGVAAVTRLHTAPADCGKHRRVLFADGCARGDEIYIGVSVGNGFACLVVRRGESGRDCGLGAMAALDRYPVDGVCCDAYVSLGAFFYFSAKQASLSGPENLLEGDAGRQRSQV